MQMLNQSNLDIGYWIKLELELLRISMISNRFKNWPQVANDRLFIGQGIGVRTYSENSCDGKYPIVAPVWHAANLQLL